jgi:hypothetical protein
MARPPCHKVDKYGGVALQDGGWATGRQPVTIIKLTGRKSKLWPQNSQTERNGPRQGKRINEMRIVPWIVCTLYRAEAMNK